MPNATAVVAVIAAAGLFATAVEAQINPTGETALAGGIASMALTHPREVVSQKKSANIPIATGQSPTNSLHNLAEGKSDVVSTPFILGFLLSKGRPPYSAHGGEKGAQLAGRVRSLNPYVPGGHSAYAYDSTGLKGWNGLKGRIVHNGAPRNGAGSGMCGVNPIRYGGCVRRSSL